LAASHVPFAIWNKVVNPFVKAVLRSPAHGLLGSRLLLVTVTGRRSGRRYTFPVNYERDEERVVIHVGWPERKRWWRNLSDGGTVELLIDGEPRVGHAQAQGDERSGVRVEVRLEPRGSALD